MNKPADLDELPEMTDDMITELKQHPVDLHLGAAEVKEFDKDWWTKKYGPKPPGLGIYALDALIVLLALIVIDLIIMSWMYLFS